MNTIYDVMTTINAMGDPHRVRSEARSEFEQTQKLSPELFYRPVLTCRDADEQLYVIFKAPGEEDLRILKVQDWYKYFKPS